MLDISRNKVPTMGQLKEAVDAFEMLKINHLQLYTEHTFAYAGHEEVWRDASPIEHASGTKVTIAADGTLTFEAKKVEFKGDLSVEGNVEIK